MPSLVGAESVENEQIRDFMRIAAEGGDPLADFHLTEN